MTEHWFPIAHFGTLSDADLAGPWEGVNASRARRERERRAELAQAASVPQKRNGSFDLKVARLKELRGASALLGQALLAKGLDITTRALRNYLDLNRTRGLAPETLNLAAMVCEYRAAQLLSQAERLRVLAKGGAA
jgi:hypothetical protein